jgi:hypothetical protein
MENYLYYGFFLEIFLKELIYTFLLPKPKVKGKAGRF